MTLFAQVKKSDMFIGALGWNITVEKSIDRPSGGRLKIFLLVHGGSDTGVRDISSMEENFLQGKLDYYFSIDTGDPMQKLTRLAEELYGNYKNKGSEINICAILSDGETFRSISLGNIKAFLFRNGKSVQIVSSSKNLIRVNGKVEENDLIIISTTEFFQRNDPQEISERMETYRRLNLSIATLQLESIKLSNYMPFFILNFEQDKSTTTLPERAGFMPGSEECVDPGKTAEKINMDKIKAALTRLVSRKFYIENNEYEKDHKKARSAAFIGMVLILILFISVVFGINKKKSDDYKNSYKAVLITAQHNLDESLNISQLNPSRSRELFIESQKAADELNAKGIKDDLLQSLLAKINENRGKILGEYEVSGDNFVDLSLITDNFNGSKVIVDEGIMYVTDNTSRKIIKINISSKRSEILAGPNKIDEIFDSAVINGKMFVLNSNGIVDPAKSKEVLLQNKFANDILASSFGSNIYVLNRVDQQINKFTYDGSHFTQGKPWLTEPVSFNLAQAKRIVIDGSVWVLSDGKLHRLIQGKDSNFRLDTTSVGEIQIDDVFTDENTSGIYILVKAKGKIIVFSKDGKYVASYGSDTINVVSSIIVAEDQRKIFLLTGSKIISLDIKHIN